MIEYATDALMPKTDIPGLTVLHESDILSKLEGIVEKVGGKVSGESVRHNDGNSLNTRQFQQALDGEEEKNV